MVDLATLQNKMRLALLERKNFSDTSKLIKKTEQLSQQDRLNIYFDSINAIFINTLKSTFPVCLKVVGKQFFCAIGFKYIEQMSSVSPDLNDYGEDFPNFIEGFEHANALPFLSDLAQLEWYWHRVSLIAPSGPVDLQGIATLSEEQLAHVRFKIPRDAFLFESTFPIHEIWVANREDSKSDTDIDLDSGGVKLILFRDSNTRRMDQLSDAIYFLLQQIAENIPFGEVGERYSQLQFDESFEDVFAVCCQQGWIASFDIESD